MNTAKNNGQPKRLLWIDGSPREGHTARLARAFLEALPPTVDVQRFGCFQQQPLPCDDCRGCYRDGRCIKPDLGDFYAALEQADYLLFSAPVYNRSFPAPMKALLDRLQRYWVMRFHLNIRPPIPKKKRAVLLTTSGGERPEGQYLEQQLRLQLTVLNTRLIGSVHAFGTDQNHDQQAFLQAAAELGRQMMEP